MHVHVALAGAIDRSRVCVQDYCKWQVRERDVPLPMLSTKTLAGPVLTFTLTTHACNISNCHIIAGDICGD